MGKIAKGVKCSVEGCGNNAFRSLNQEKVSSVGLHVIDSKRAYLCKDHYKIYKKATKQETTINKWRFSAR